MLGGCTDFQAPGRGRRSSDVPDIVTSFFGAPGRGRHILGALKGGGSLVRFCLAFSHFLLSFSINFIMSSFLSFCLRFFELCSIEVLEHSVFAEF